MGIFVYLYTVSRLLKLLGGACFFGIHLAIAENICVKVYNNNKIQIFLPLFSISNNILRDIFR